jgi:ABC-type transport system involved in cytochrome bd biosynthesis fused ATPase/permease subunit
MLMSDLQYARVLFNPYLLDEAHLHDDADAKEALNKVLQKLANTSIVYA